MLTEGPGWRWVMFVNPIACAVIIPAALAVLPHDRPAAASAKFDLVGSLLVTGGMLMLVFALVQAPAQGWGATRTWRELAGAAVLLGAFLVNERITRDPLLPLGIFRTRGLLAANITGFVGFSGLLAMFYFLTLYMQNVLGYSPIKAGAAYLPLTFAVGVSSGIGAKLLTGCWLTAGAALVALRMVSTRQASMAGPLAPADEDLPDIDLTTASAAD